MYEVKQAEVARALDILRAGPLTAARFALKMWPERCAGDKPGTQSQRGHGLLRRLAEVGYVERVGDLWMIRRISAAFPVDTADRTADPTAVGLLDGLGVGLPVGQADGLPVGPPLEEADRERERQRLHRLVQLATEPVPTVTHDAALGDIAIRGFWMNEALAQACAYVVLLGRSHNVYLQVYEDMLVALTPIEAARALHIRWMQSGRPPELLNDRAWLFGDDGLIGDPQCWIPIGYDVEEWLVTQMEDVPAQLRRQREAAGLA